MKDDKTKPSGDTPVKFDTQVREASSFTKKFTCAILLLSLCLLNMTNINAILFAEYPELVSRDKPHRISQLQELVPELKRLVGAKGKVGYVSDLDPERENSEFHTEKGYVQYAIVPIRVLSGDHSRFVIGNFSKGLAPDQIDGKKLKLIRKIDERTALYSREGS